MADKLAFASVFHPTLVLALLAFMLTLAFPVQVAGQAFNVIKRVSTTEPSAEKLTREQCLERARSTRINKNLRGAKLNDADLSNAVLLSADMRAANLKKTILIAWTGCMGLCPDAEGSCWRTATPSAATPAAV